MRHIFLIVVGFFSAFGVLAVMAEAAENSNLVADAPGGGLQIVGDKLYIAAWGHGFHVLDIANQVHPKWIGGWNNHTCPLGVYVADDFACLANRTSGFDVIDVHDPESPAQTGHLFTGGDGQTVYVIKHLAYLADMAKGLEVIDVSNPAKPELVGKADVPDQAVSVQVSDGFVYATYNNKGLRIFELTNPTRPKQISELSALSALAGIQIVGNLVYFVNGNNFQVLDVAVRSAPVVRSSCRLEGFADRGVYVSANHAYVPFHCGLQIIDLSNPDKARGVGIFTAGYCPWDVRVLGNYAYLMDGGANLHILDVSNPARPTEVNRVGTENFCSQVVSLTNFIASPSAVAIQTDVGGAITDAPPQLADMVRVADGAFSFTLRGVPESVYYIQASADLITWTIISTITLPADGTLRISDADAHLFNNRFYRATKKQ